jgi:LCP family protein required for cell wall assembly
MRDIYVAIPGYGYNKLNAAYYLGGFDLLSETVALNFRLDIDQFIAVNFNAFSKAVDVMGGIDIEMTADEAQTVEVGSTAGLYHLNGEQALTYARIRYVTGIDGDNDDFGRNKRQRTVLEALMTNAKSMNIATLSTVLSEVLPEVSTNFGWNELTKYAVNSSSYLKYEIIEYSLPQYGEYDDPYVTGVGRVLTLTDQKESVLELQHAIYG